MIVSKNWLTKKWDFNFPVSRYPEFLETLKSTPQKLESLISSLTREKLIHKKIDDWSIQENAGHLITVDELFIGRLEDYLNRLEELRTADITGSSTNKVDYNSWNIQVIVKDFRRQRQKYIQNLEKLDSEDFEKSAFHPRLKTQMRLCDMLYFQAEHDKYHLEIIEILKRN